MLVPAVTPGAAVSLEELAFDKVNRHSRLSSSWQTDPACDLRVCVCVCVCSVLHPQRGWHGHFCNPTGGRDSRFEFDEEKARGE